MKRLEEVPSIVLPQATRAIPTPNCLTLSDYTGMRTLWTADSGVTVSVPRVSGTQ
jgi:hypothetical protein